MRHKWERNKKKIFIRISEIWGGKLIDVLMAYQVSIECALFLYTKKIKLQ